MALTRENYSNVALNFVQALMDRDYAKAYGMTARDYQGRTSLDAMRAEFEAIVPPDWGVGPVEVGQTNDMDGFPDRQPSDLGWVYVSIHGDVYSEAVTVIIAEENATLVVRDVEFGRP